MRLVHDRVLLDKLEQQGGRPHQGDVWRVTWTSRNPLQGGGSGRWNAPNSIQVVYSSCSADGAIAEIYYHLAQQPVLSSADKSISRLRVQTENTLSLLDKKFLTELGLGPQSLALTDAARSQEIAAAAHLLDYDSLLVPSARWACDNLILFPDNLSPDGVSLEDTKAVNWPSWRESNAPEWERRADELRNEKASLIGKPPL